MTSGDKFARRVAKRYRKRGLDKTSKRIVAFLEWAGVQDATVLEIGGGKTPKRACCSARPGSTMSAWTAGGTTSRRILMASNRPTS